MTHDHAEDAALCDAALRCPGLGSIGLIGSAAKWARFRHALAAEGHSREALDRITTPIGLPGIGGKEPATIAVSVAAALVLAFERAGVGPERAGAADDPLPWDGPRHPRRPLRRRRRCARTPTPACSSGTASSSSGGPSPQVRARHPGEDVVDLAEGILLPGLVDTHVHFPQLRAIGGLGMPLLDWLERCALPEEARLGGRPPTPPRWQREFLGGLVQAGTTTALVFGAHFAAAVDVLFEQASRVGLRLTSGLVVSDRLLRPDLLTTPQRAYDEALELARRWHDVGRSRYAVVPRFSLSCTGELLDACAALLRDVPGSWFTSHINENVREIEEVTPALRRRHVPGHVRPPRPCRPPQRARAQRAPVGRRAVAPGVPRQQHRALPDQQLRPRQRAVPAAAPPRRGSARRPRLRRRRGHRLLPVQGGSAGVLRPADARRAGCRARAAPSAPPRDGRGRAVPGPRRRRGRPQRRQAVRRGVGASAARQHLRRSPCATPAVPRRHWRRSSRSRHPPTSRASGWTTRWCTRPPRATGTGGRAASCGRGAGNSPGRRSPPPCRWPAAGTGAPSTHERRGRHVVLPSVEGTASYSPRFHSPASRVVAPDAGTGGTGAPGRIRTCATSLGGPPTPPPPLATCDFAAARLAPGCSACQMGRQFASQPVSRQLVRRGLDLSLERLGEELRDNQ